MADESGGWKFSQCFGDKGNTTEVSEGMVDARGPPWVAVSRP